MNARRDYGGIDRFRIIAAFLVVAIHTFPLLSAGIFSDVLFTHVIARVAVPFFLATTGFFLLTPFADGCRSSAKPVLRFVRKTALVYLAAIVLYLPLNIYAGHFCEINSVYRVAQMLFIDGTLYHLWYLPAAIIGTVLVWALLRFSGFKATVAIASLLYAVGLLGDSYFGAASSVPVLDAFYQGLFAWCDYTRNGLFYAPIFLLAGVFAARYPAQSGRRAFFGFALVLLLMVAEGAALFFADIQRHDSMYVMLPACVFLLMLWLASFRIPSEKALRDVSLFIYLVHPWAIVAVRGFAKLAGMDTLFIDNSIVHYLAVCTLSAELSLVAVAAKNWLVKAYFPKKRVIRLASPLSIAMSGSDLRMRK